MVIPNININKTSYIYFTYRINEAASSALDNVHMVQLPEKEDLLTGKLLTDVCDVLVLNMIEACLLCVAAFPLDTCVCVERWRRVIDNMYLDVVDNGTIVP